MLENIKVGKSVYRSRATYLVKQASQYAGTHTLCLIYTIAKEVDLSRLGICLDRKYSELFSHMEKTHGLAGTEFARDL